MDALWLLPLGFVAGAVGSMVGLGGGIIMVPAMTLAGYSPALAVSSSLYAIFSNAAASTISYARAGRISYRTGLAISALAIPGAAAGAVASTWVGKGEFQALFGALMVAVAIYMALKRNIIEGRRAGPAAAIIAGIASLGAGIVSSFFGIGGGIVFVPVMVAVLGMGMARAAPTSQFALLFISLAGMVSHTVLGHTDLIYAGLLSAGAFAGGLVGARLASRMRQKNLQIIMAIMVAAAAIRLFIEAIPEWL